MGSFVINSQASRFQNCLNYATAKVAALHAVGQLAPVLLVRNDVFAENRYESRPVH